MEETGESVEDVESQTMYLIGPILPEITGNKLPSQKQVLQYFFHLTQKCKKSIDDSATVVGNTVLAFWERTGLYTRQQHRVVQKVKDLYNEYMKIRKKKSRRTSNQLFKGQEFSRKIKNLFDVAHGEILDMIDKKRLEFYEDQKKDGIVGYIEDIEGNFDQSTYEKRIKQDVVFQKRLEETKEEMIRNGK